MGDGNDSYVTAFGMSRQRSVLVGNRIGRFCEPNEIIGYETC